MVAENNSHKCRLKNIDEIRNYFVEEIEQNTLMSKKYKNICIEHFLISASAVTGCISILLFLLCMYSYRNYDLCKRMD